MNYYCIVEGIAERRIYPKWIKYCNDSLKLVYRIEDVDDNCVFLISGGGYPNIFNTIENGLKDIRDFNVFNKLVISIDAELVSVEEKEKEINEEIKKIEHIIKGIDISIILIIQNFCLETWALGHRKIFRRKTTNQILRDYQAFYNVKNEDPEGLPNYPPKDYSRVEFAYKYLHYGIKDLYTSLTYTKSNPKFIGEEHYFKELISRYQDTSHINSFGVFLQTFKK